MPSYDARLIPDIDRISNGNRREHCSAHRSRVTTIRRNQGQQVRIELQALGEEDPPPFALYTVIDVHDDEPDVVFVGHKNLDDLHDRLGLSGTDPFTGRINSQGSAPTLEDDKAKQNSEFVERLTDNGRHRGLVVIAPHGGDIEIHTDEQARRVRERLAPKCVSVWLCKGFKKWWCLRSLAHPRDGYQRRVISKTESGDRASLRVRGRFPRMGARFHLHREIGAF